MCGIAGIIKQNTNVFKNDNFKDVITGMLGQIKHRGPDESGIYINDKTACGTVRLSIIDVKNGQQPMIMQDRYVLNFNGEIFNYLELRQILEKEGLIFATKSDTEVVLQSLIHWGPDAFLKFDGHFAISFYDKQDERLLLARDAFGEKPLFYTKQEEFFAFASEIKSFRAIPAFSFKLSQQNLSHAAWFWTALPNESVFEKIESVRPGHFVIFEKNTMAQKRYFDFPLLEKEKTTFSYTEAQKKLKQLMHQSIERRLRSDVEVASYLSGGLDSTIVTCLAREMVGHKLKTFSVTFDHPDYDESGFQQGVSDALQTEHHTVKISAADIVDNFENVVEHAETALFRTALTPMYLLSEHVRNENIKVVLTGEGADEFFMGYDIFKETLFRENYDQFDNDDARIEEILNLYPYIPHFDQENAQQLLQYFKHHTDQSTNFFSHNLRFSNGTLANQLLVTSTDRDTAESDLSAELFHIANIDFKDQSKLSQAQITDIKTLMEGYLLSSQGDRMTSANSVEGRCPFLNLDLVEFAQSLPLEMKLDKGFEKKILRETFADKIPNQNALRRKQPYRAPDAQPFILDKSFVNERILQDLLKNSQIIKPDLGERFIQKLLAKAGENISPREDQAFIFMLSTLMLEQSFCSGEKFDKKQPINLKVMIDETGKRTNI